jgi:hypothetical protein
MVSVSKQALGGSSGQARGCIHLICCLHWYLNPVSEEICTVLQASLETSAASNSYVAVYSSSLAS